MKKKAAHVSAAFSLSLFWLENLCGFSCGAVYFIKLEGSVGAGVSVNIPLVNVKIEKSHVELSDVFGSDVDNVCAARICAIVTP